MSSNKNRRELLNNIVTFVQVGRSESFTAAARALNMSPSGVSRSISRLEGHLNIKLVDRTTRSIGLTADGEAYFKSCERILNELEEAEDEVKQSNAEPSGRLRLRLPKAFGRSIIVPALSRFIDLYPNITIDARFETGALDSLEHGVDVALQLGEPQDAHLVAKKFWPINYHLCASPDYIRKHGAPETVADLESHRRICYLAAHSEFYRPWTFNQPGGAASITGPGNVNLDDAYAVLEAAEAGLGIAYLMDFLIRDSIREGKLNLIMPSHVYDGVSAYIIFPPTRVQSRRVKAFVGFLHQVSAEYFNMPPLWTAPRV